LELLDGIIDLGFAEELTFDWFYSDSNAESDIPGELRVNAVDSVDPQTGAFLSTSVRQSLSAADFRYTDLSDEVRSYGWNLTYPFETADFFVEAKVGGSQFDKGRQLEQLRFGLGTTTTAANPILVGEPGDVFSDENILNPTNGFAFSDFLIGTESYLAAEKISGAYGQIDATWRDTWRVNAGVRWEEFQQISVPYDPLSFTGGSKFLVPLNSQADLESFATIEDDYYPSLAVTWMKPEVLGAQDFQLRFGWSQTIARPDLRVVTPATYIDPVTEAIVSYYPTSVITVRLRLQNLLDDNTEIQQSGVTIFEQEVGTTARVNLRVQF
jgi:outer membrane receptor protein involved in Fe transport